MKLFIFGSTGDLVKRKVMKALQDLNQPELEIFAIGRKKLDREEYRELICSDWCSLDFRRSIHYIQVDFNSLDKKSLTDFLDQEGINFFYISLPPAMHKKIFSFLAELLKYYKLKVLVEKPFGENHKSAIELKGLVDSSGLKEQFRISDHYLFKKGFSDFKNKKPDSAKKIRIVSHEELGLENRHGYYDSAGALRDMIQSHFINIILKKMNIKINPETIKVNKLVKGQYEDYEKELGEESSTETYALVEFEDRGKKFEFSTGKAMKNKETFIEIDEERIKSGDENSYVELFKSFLSLDLKDFPTPEESVLGWKILEKFEEFGKKDPKLVKYRRHSSASDIAKL